MPAKDFLLPLILGIFIASPIGFIQANSARMSESNLASWDAIGVLGASYSTKTGVFPKGKRGRTGTGNRETCIDVIATRFWKLAYFDPYVADPLLRDSFDTCVSGCEDQHPYGSKFPICFRFAYTLLFDFLILIICFERLGVRCLLVEIWAKASGRNCLKSAA